MLIPVILSGGSGSRLWPVSRSQHPKQFHALVGQHSLFQDTLRRAQLISEQPPLVVCNELHRFKVLEQAKLIGIDLGTVLLEPMAKNTAPAITLAALAAMAEDPEAILWVMPADHCFEHDDALQSLLPSVIAHAAADHLVTFGVVPTTAATGYGYIQRGAALTEGAHAVNQFVEKPNLEKAQQYQASGEYYWNSGMFAFKAAALLQAMQAHQPKIYQACETAWSGRHADLSFTRLDAAEFSSCPSDSIDYALMEQAQSVVVLPLEAAWSDVGAWSSLHAVGPQDASGNACSGDVVSIDSHHNLIRSESRLVATIGLENHVVIETKDTVLVAPQSRSEDIKKLVGELKNRERSETEYHQVVYRPWGSYEVLVECPVYKVKRIVVKAGAQLSLQRHQHRSEHWVVVRGLAEAQVGDTMHHLTENQSIDIPKRCLHRLYNPGTEDMELIEVQLGSYLGEDDIERFEDQYGRVPQQSTS